jgi:hypothetical protein
MPTKRPPLVGEVVPTLADRGCCVVSATDPPVVSLGFLDRSRYYFFQVAPQLSSRFKKVHTVSGNNSFEQSEAQNNKRRYGKITLLLGNLIRVTVLNNYH